MAERQVKEHEQEDDLDLYGETVSTSECGCFRHFCYQWKQSNNGENRGFLRVQKGEHREITFTWIVKKGREVSEFLAGPKCKNLLRSIISSKYMIIKYYTKKGTKKTEFQYDPHSYALNFDDGGVTEEQHHPLPTFASRFAAPLAEAVFRDEEECVH